MKKQFCLFLFVLLFFSPFIFSLDTDVSNLKSMPNMLNGDNVSSSRNNYSPSIDIPKKLEGDIDILVMYVKFPDVSNTTSNPDDWTSGSSTSLDSIILSKSYWSDVSYGKINITFWKSDNYYPELPGTSAYYGKDFDYDSDGVIDRDPNSYRCGEPWYKVCQGVYTVNSLIEDTLKIYDVHGVNFTKYDHFLIVLAGDSQVNTKNTDDAWPKCVCDIDNLLGHRFQTNDGIINTNKKGIIIITENDIMGTFSHEIGHLLGLPDLYDYSNDYTYVNTWSIMATGNILPGGYKSNGQWGWLGTNPTQLIGVEKVWLGWLEPLVVNPGEKKVVTIQYPISKGDGSGTYVVKLPFPSDSIVAGDPQDHYFMLELRKKIGRDSKLPSEGILVTLINETKKGGTGIVRIVDGYDGDGLDNAALKAGWYGRLVIPSYFIFNGSQVQDLIGVHVVSIGNYDDGVAVIEVHHGLPDLLIENIDVASSINEGDNVNFHVTVRNRGQWESSSAFVKVYVDGNLVDTVSTSTIQGFGTQILSVGSWTATPGDHTLKIEVDPGNDLIHFSGTESGKIMELDEENNEKTLSFNVTAVAFAQTVTVTTSTQTVSLTETITATITTPVTEIKTVTAVPVTDTQTVSLTETITATIITPVTEIKTLDITETLTQYVTETELLTQINVSTIIDLVTSTITEVNTTKITDTVTSTSTEIKTENSFLSLNISVVSILFAIVSVLIGILISKKLNLK